ncbi:double-stranded RNA-binding protein Staufen [Mytilus galloprovincialis]|uniref:Double-stranded RNA-binding protein Staufen n=2 Tax=Mytilus galloprovincialis TaxID=29158 RepID=A0A8B6F7U7_MYTGA|nr:double-stranded RNA-binding protein Staufen [Mytilus galloprovincialis]VDI45736.1 double-stranded RNA-binding protein Staufen [Mytilus galloprovincialis]
MQHNMNSYPLQHNQGMPQPMPQRQQQNIIISGSQRNKGGMIGPGMTQQTPTILQHNPGLNQPTILQQNPAAQYPTSLPPTSVMPPYQTTQHNIVPQKPTPPPVSQPNQNGIIHLKGGAAVAAQNGTTLPSGEQQQQNLEDEEGKEDIQTESSETESLANTKEKTPMCLINELARYNKISHQYTLDDEQGPAHKKTFYVTLKLGDNETYAENGPSIKKAQHSAAAVALEKTSYTHPPPKPPKNRTTHELELNALAMKRGEQTFYKPLDTRYPHYPQQNYNYRGVYNHRYHYPRMPRVFYVSLKCGQREFIGEGHNRQEARNDAATKALNILKKLPVPNDDPKKSDTQTPETQEPNEKDLLKSEISLVHEIALRRNLNVIFDVIRESGPPHMKSFVTKCRVGEFETEAEGNSKKVSKKKAAELMLDKLKELSPLPPMAQRPKNKQNQNKKKSKNIIKVQNQMQKTDPNYGVGINPISRLIQIQQAEQKKEPVFTLITERSLLRRREFVMQVQIEDKTCTGVGPNKKLAKRHAAEQMLTLLGYNKPSPQPTKPAIKTATTPEQTTGSAEKKVTFQEKPETATPVSSAGPGEIANGKSGRQLMPGLLLLRDSNYTSGTQNMYQAQPPMTEPLVFGAGHMRPELQLRDIATKSKLEIKFDEFAGKNTEILCRVTLLTNPHQMFHGTGPNSDYAKDAAALEALKFLAELGREEIKMTGDGPHMKTSDQLANSTLTGAPGRVGQM